MGSLKDREAEYFENGDTNNYYHYLEGTDYYKYVENKLKSNEKLSEEEWDLLLNRLYLVTCKSIIEEDKVGIVDDVLSVIGKAGMFFSKNERANYWYEEVTRYK